MSTSKVDSSPTAFSSPSSILRNYESDEDKGREIWDGPPPIELVNTFDSSELDSHSDGPSLYFETQDLDSSEFVRIQVVELGGERENGPHGTPRMDEDTSSGGWLREAVPLYIAIFAIFGNASRVFIGRLFGSDCSVGGDNAPNDFLEPFFSQICITNSGLTEQTGGALFLDLPANMIGSLIMGVIASAEHPLPWFRLDHPLQKHKALIAGFGTGYCGSLTTCK